MLFIKVLGIIAEYNPFHNGHIYHIDEAKKLTGAEYVIVIVSGPFTQAGNISIIDKYQKAKIALEYGADLVIELPQIYSVSSASYFAYGAITVLNALNIVDYICFGSESNDINILKNISKKILKSDEKIWNDIKSIEKNISFANSRYNVLKEILSDKEISILKNSNDILGIEYINSLTKLNSSIIPFSIKRNNNFLSATKIRENIKNNEKVIEFVPEKVSNLINSQYELNDEMYKILRYKILNESKFNLQNIKDVKEGLENKILKEFKMSTSYESFIFNLKSKRYEMSRIKRIVINTLLNITKTDFEYAINNKIAYCHVLSANTAGKKLLSKISKISNIDIITSINDPKLEKLSQNTKKYLMVDIYAENIYSIINNNNINKDYTNKL